MYAEEKKYTRASVARMLAASFGCCEVGRFGPKTEEHAYKSDNVCNLAECLKLIGENIRPSGEDLSSLSDIHPSWITEALASESPKIIGIVLRWLSSRHVRYILDHLPKRTKMALPKLVESFSVPTPMLSIIKAKFEGKISLPVFKLPKEPSFEDISFLKYSDLAVLLRDLGFQELAMAFQNIEASGIRVLLNRMSISDARALQQRMKDVADIGPAILKDARYTILEVAMDQEDIERLLMEIGIASFSKALKDDSMLPHLQMRLEPNSSYILRRYIDQHLGANKQAYERQEMILKRMILLSGAGSIDNMWAHRMERAC